MDLEYQLGWNDTVELRDLVGIPSSAIVSLSTSLVFWISLSSSVKGDDNTNTKEFETKGIMDKCKIFISYYSFSVSYLFELF